MTSVAYLMTGCVTRISARLSRYRNKSPIVSGGMQVQFEHTEGLVIADLAIRYGWAERVVFFAASTNHELTNALERVGSAGWSLSCESLVVMIVTIQHYIDTGIIERL